MTLLPAHTETLVLPIDGDQVEHRIEKGIDDFKFNGVVGQRTFTISVLALRPPQFQPRIKGRIEDSSRGSLIFLRYELLPATRMLLIFVFVNFLVLGAVGVYQEGSAWPAFGVLIIIVIFRFVALANIRLHKEPLRQALLDILS